jgi:hypothetical protein
MREKGSEPGHWGLFITEKSATYLIRGLHRDLYIRRNWNTDPWVYLRPDQFESLKVEGRNPCHK